MSTVNEFPDIEALAATALRDAAIPGVNTVNSSIPSNPQYPLIVVKRLGGLPVHFRYMDEANIQVDVWGGSKSDARDIAARARTVLFDLMGTSTGTVWVANVTDSLGLTWLPDPVTARDRYFFSVRIAARAV